MNAQVPRGRFGDGNWISDESPQLLWTDRHLVFKQATTQIGPEVQLDLIFDPVLPVGPGVSAVAPLIARSPFFALIRKLGLPEAHL